MECIICYQDVSLKEIHKTSCNHEFCINCYKKWSSLKNTCPICRTSQPIINNYNANTNQNYTINQFYMVNVNNSGLNFIGKLCAIDNYFQGKRYTFVEIRESSYPIANIYWTFNNLATISHL